MEFGRKIEAKLNNDATPCDLVSSMAADVYPKDDSAKSIVIVGSIGEESLFHSTFGYYGRAVDDRTAIRP